MTQSPDDARWQTWFYLGVLAVALSVVTALAVFTNAACGSDDAPSTASPTETPVPTATPTLAAATATTAPPQTETAVPAPTTPAPASPTSGPSQPATPRPTATEDPAQLVGCGMLAPVDQNRRVAPDCAVGPLVNVEGYLLNSEAAAAWGSMKADAAAKGIELSIISAYRSYDVQKQLYDQEVAAYGPGQNTSAKPGHSEHQLGTTVDINDLSGSFGDTPAGIWLQQNAARYGFIMSYPAGREGVTGYAYEPWHWRYVGPGTASSCQASGLTLNRCLG